MGVMDKLAFWKRKPAIPDLPSSFGDSGSDLGLGSDMGLGKDLGLPKDEDFGFEKSIPGTEQPTPQPIHDPTASSQPHVSFSQPSMPQPNQAPIQSPNMELVSKDMELISVKLDALKAAIENVNQRLANIERLAHTEIEEARKVHKW